MRLGVIACGVMRREISALIDGDPDVTEVVFLDSARHVHPERLRASLLREIAAMAPRVDAVFLGYGRCRGLDGVEDAASLPVVRPACDDCLAILLTPERYASEREAEPGTWFMTPGWAEVGAGMVIRELHLDSAADYGMDPMATAQRLFAGYSRGLFVDTGAADVSELREKAKAFCADFGLRYEETAAASPILAEAFVRAKRAAEGAAAE